MRLLTLLFTLFSLTYTHAAVTTLSTRTLTTTQQFLDMTTNDGGIIAGRSLKFLIDQRTSTPGVYFMNMNYKVNGKTPDSAIYHYDFARAVLGITDSVATFNARTYNVQNKRYVAGTIQQYNLASGIVYGIQLYPEDVAAETTILNIMKALIPKVTIPSAKLHFVSTAPQQSFNTVITQIRNIRSPYTNATSIDTILNGITFIPMQLGTAYGYLRIFPTNNDLLSPYDIPVFEELPLDLAVVAACITKQYQDTNAHVNLKSKERGTPNMVLRDASPTHPTLQAWNNQPVKLVITQNSYELFASSDTEVIAKNSRNNLPWVNVQWRSDRTLRTNVEMCPGTSATPCIDLGAAYGTKSANLGFLMNRNVLGRTEYSGSLSQQFGYNLVPDGFGIPIQFYHDFVNDPRNSNLKNAITDLIQMEHNGTSTPTSRATQSAAVQKLFYKAYLNPTFLDTVINKIYSTLPGIYKVKIRSSANAEDLPQFDGAGLHDSFSANLNKTDNTDFSCKVVEGDDGVDTKLEVKPKTVQCAIKAVYASLWNIRAIAERSYARLNHTQVGMGIGVVAKYDTEAPVAANSVVISRVVGSNNIYGYSFSNQAGNNLVTNPTPGTQSENVMALFSDIAANTPVTFSVTRYATPNASEPQLTRTVYTTAQMKQLLKIVQKTENAYCRYKTGYYPGGSCTYVTVDPKKPKAIDMEFKYLETGEWVAKQLREFGGGAPTGSVARILEFSASEEDLQVPWVEDENMMMEQGSSLSVPLVVGVTVGVSVAILLAVMLVIRQRAAYQASAKIAGIATHSSSPVDVELNNNYVSNPATRV